MSDHVPLNVQDAYYNPDDCFDWDRYFDESGQIMDEAVAVNAAAFTTPTAYSMPQASLSTAEVDAANAPLAGAR